MSEADRLPCPVCQAPLSRWRVMVLADWDRLICKTCGTSLRRTSRAHVVWEALMGPYLFFIVVPSWIKLFAFPLAGFSLLNRYKSYRNQVSIEIAQPFGVGV